MQPRKFPLHRAPRCVVTRPSDPLESRPVPLSTHCFHARPFPSKTRTPRGRRHAAASRAPQQAEDPPTRLPVRSGILRFLQASHGRRISVHSSRVASRRASAGFQVVPAIPLVYSLSPRSFLRRRSSSGPPPATPGRRPMPTRVRRQPQRQLDVLHARRGHTHRHPARASGVVCGRAAQGKKAAAPRFPAATAYCFAHSRTSQILIDIHTWNMKYDPFCSHSRPILLIRQKNTDPSDE